MRAFLVILFFAFATFCKSQTVGPPSLRCVDCSAAGDLKLTWIAPADPGSKFFSYEIFRANTFAGPYISIGTVNTYTLTSYNDIGAGGNTASRYYFIKTHSGPTGTVVSTASDTVRSIYLNLSNPGDGTAFLVYNNLHQPKLSTSATQFKVYRQNPPTWVNIKNTSALNYKDTISICNVFYNYQLQLSDASGCISNSNISGANFKDLIPPNLAQLDSVSVNCGGQSVLGWNPSSSADCFGYVIYEFKAGTWQSIDTVYGINNTIYSYTSTTANGASVNYCIASIDSCGNVSQLGSAHNTINLKTKYDVCSRATTLKWNPYKNLPLGVSHYQVYCSTNAGPYLLLSSTTDSTFQHTGLTPGKTYCYRVRVVSTFGTYTSGSNCSCLVATAPPSSSFVYLKSASVDLNQTVTITLYCDTLVPCKGFMLYKSEDASGGTFNSIGFVKYTGKSILTFNDADVTTSSKNYFYKAEVIDSCGNSRFSSNIGKTVVLKVKNNNDKIFENNLSWDDYYTYSGGVAGYYVFRIVNEVLDPNPVNFVPFGMTTYTDNVEDIVSESGKVGYYVTAVEGFGNTYGLIGSANSNKGEAYVEGKVFVPGAFAPKGENRIWKPVTQFVEKTDYKVTVFNRWGEKVWETTSDDEGWDGSGLEDNTYVYLLQYKNARGEFIEMKGTVTMVR